jgi:hypothetical protein
MHHSHTLMRAAATALAIVAAAAPAAIARPADTAAPSQHVQDLRSPAAKDATAPSQRLQNLRWLSAGDRIPTSSQAGTTSADTHSATAGALAQERYYQTYSQPTAETRPPAGPDSSDDDTPWAIIGLALAFAGLAAAAATGVVRRTGRSRVPA